MNKDIVIEALDFAIRKTKITILMNGELNELNNNYYELKSAYNNLRFYNKYKKNICIIALNIFKEHLESEIYFKSDLKFFILMKIKKINNEINILK